MLEQRPDPLELIAPDLTGERPARVTERGARGLLRTGRRLAIVAAAAGAALLGVGVITAGAYFTDARTVNSAVDTGAVKLAIATPVDSSNNELPFTVSRLVPLSASDAADDTKGSLVTFQVKGSSLDTRGRVELVPVTSGTTAGVLPYVQVKIFNGVNWSAATALSTTGSSPTLVTAASNEFSLAKNATSGDFKVRVFLSADTPNSLQNATVKFTLGTKSIQGLAPGSVTY